MKIGKIQKKFAFLTTSLAMLLACSSTASTPNKMTDWSRVQRIVTEKMEAIRTAENQKIPGMAYSVFTPNEILFSDSLGYADMNSRQRIDTNTSLFRITAVSIPFLSVATAQLIERGILRLNTQLLSLKQVPLVRKIIEIEKNNPQRLARWKKITIGHLLSHHAGISKDIPGVTKANMHELMFFNIEALDDNSYTSMETFLNGLSQIEFLYDEPGKFRYSNLGLSILARVVEGVNREGLSYDEFVKRNIFDRLRMENSFYDIPENRIQDMVVSHSKLNSNQESNGRNTMGKALLCRTL